MVEQPLRILQINTMEGLGGAARVALGLHQAYLEHGLQSWLAVGWKANNADPRILLVPNYECRSPWARLWLAAAGRAPSPLVGEVHGFDRARVRLRWIGQPARLLKILRGHEDFDFPGTWRLLDLPNHAPTIIHCHNLHGEYFDLRALPWLSQQAPLVATLHDAWLLSGHCAHSLDCDRWKAGCGNCPYLTIYPRIRRDESAQNWQRKQAIYARTRLHVATPSDWLMQKVKRSMLAPAVQDSRVIPNGVDLAVFHPAESRKARAVLGLPQDAKVLLFAAVKIGDSVWKDYETLRAAIGGVAERLSAQRVIFLALGADDPGENIGRAQVRFVPYQRDTETVARYYQAADVYIHSATADTFPNTILEAMACGTPVVATAVGGIPEQVQDGVTGFLVPARDAQAMAEAIATVLTDDALRTRLGVNAAQDAAQRFSLSKQVDEYLKWYREISGSWVSVARPGDIRSHGERPASSPI